MTRDHRHWRPPTAPCHHGLVMERLASPVRERPVSLALPKINVAGDLIAAAAALTDAVTQGEVTPGEAASLTRSTHRSICWRFEDDSYIRRLTPAPRICQKIPRLRLEFTSWPNQKAAHQ